MATLTFEWDKDVLKLGPRAERAVRSALRKSGGDAIRKARAFSTKRLRERKAFKAAAVRKGLSVSFPRGQRLEDLVWAMRVDAGAIPLSAFPYGQNRKGVRVRVNKGKSSVIKSAFVATMKSGHRGIFVRSGKARLPIEELFSTRLTDVFKDENMIDDVFNAAGETFKSSFDRLLPLEMKKAGFK